MKRVIRQVMLVCIGLNIGMVAIATTIGSKELVLVAGLSIASCAVGLALNKDENSDV